MAISSQSKAKVFNLSDDLPATQLEVAQFAASLLKKSCPQTVIGKDLVSEMARSFYKEKKSIKQKAQRRTEV